MGPDQVLAVTAPDPTLRRRAVWILALGLALGSGFARAQDDPPARAIVAVVGDVDTLTIGQGGFCASRTDVPSPAGKQFRIPAGERTYFSVRWRIHTQMVITTCEGDYSFLPAAGQLHVLRYSVADDRCRVEGFQSAPGATPMPMAVQFEARRSCLAP